MTYQQLVKKVTTGAVAAMAIIGVLLVPTHSVGAADILSGACKNDTSDNPVCKAKGENAQSQITQVINTLLLILGSISVIMIIIGGYRFVTSNGNPEQVKSAKNTVLYSAIGLVVAIMAYAIVFFVLEAFGGSGGDRSKQAVHSSNKKVS